MARPTQKYPTYNQDLLQEITDYIGDYDAVSLNEIAKFLSINHNTAKRYVLFLEANDVVEELKRPESLIKMFRISLPTNKN